MTTIDMDPGFDTLSCAQRLEEAGVEGKQAQAHAEAARDSQAGLATKADLANLEARLQASFYRALSIQTAALAGIVKFL